ncbi:MAG: hypothetical protein ACOX8S_02015 [Christensenellales bacterium]|jgi:hypothetical protein
MKKPALLILLIFALPLIFPSSLALAENSLEADLASWLYDFYGYKHRVYAGEEFSETELTKYFDLSDPDSYDFYEHEVLVIYKEIKTFHHYAVQGKNILWSDYDHSVVVGSVRETSEGLIADVELTFLFDLFNRANEYPLGGVLEYSLKIGESATGFYLKEKGLNGYFMPESDMDFAIHEFRANQGGETYRFDEIYSKIIGYSDPSSLSPEQDMKIRYQFLEAEGFINSAGVLGSACAEFRKSVELLPSGGAKAYKYEIAGGAGAAGHIAYAEK